MELIKDTIQNVMRLMEAKKKDLPAQDDIEGSLKKTLTKRELKHIKYKYFKRGVLIIDVDSSSWLYHLNLKKVDLLTKIGRRISGLKDIRLRLGA